MRPALPHPAPDERGFILVGVVTFMLALTILGLSLFALSSYEGQFFAASAAREQSLQNSESGMELVKVLLAAKDSKLEDAHRAEGQMGVTSAMAYQWRSDVPSDTTSVGPVNWDSTMVQDPSHVGVVIVVEAKSGGVDRTLQARFVPGVAENPYQRLLVAGTGVSVDSHNSPSDPTVLELSGGVWQPVASGADTSWTDHVHWLVGRPIERGTPPAPLVHDFVQQHWPSAEDPNDAFNHDNNSYSLTLNGATDSPTFFRSPTSPTKEGEIDDYQHAAYSFYVGAELDVSVKGIAVWVIPKGVCFRHRVTVDAVDSNPSTLVIVAEPSVDDPADGNRGIWFMGGLKIREKVNVYLVSQGDISLVHRSDHGKSNDAKTASIVAGGRIEIGGPDSSEEFTLNYDPSLMDVVSDQLLALGALPPVVGGTGANFVALKKSWLETTPR